MHTFSAEAQQCRRHGGINVLQLEYNGEGFHQVCILSFVFIGCPSLLWLESWDVSPPRQGMFVTLVVPL